MKNLLFLVFITLPLFQACSDGHQHHGKDSAVLLDNGNRWQANPETTTGIADMQAIVAKYEDKMADAASRKSLRGELETTFQAIFKACTMTGPAHDQLHNYLLPMKDLMKKVESENADESAQALSQLKQHLAEYQTFFQ